MISQVYCNSCNWKGSAKECQSINYNLVNCIEPDLVDEAICGICPVCSGLTYYCQFKLIRHDNQSDSLAELKMITIQNNVSDWVIFKNKSIDLNDFKVIFEYQSSLVDTHFHEIFFGDI